MNTIFKFSISSFLVCFCLLAVAQPVAEPIRTESSIPAEDIFIDDIVSKRLIIESRLLAQQPIREADLVWEKRIQRVIDTREKLNLAFRSQELNLFNTMRQLIANGDITVFADEKFTTALTQEEVDGKLSKVDTIPDFDYETYTEVIKIVKNDVNWENIFSYRIKEVIYFDKQRSRVDIRILGIAPIYASPEDEAQGIPPYPLFWVYYPEARAPLSKFRVFNDNNDMAPMTWTEVFDSRVFTSYIYKKSNVLDYRLKDYFVANPDAEVDRTGIDMLLQSEKIKNELLNFEHDLWEY
jgi:gliding motility associated protien GldN